MLNRPKIICHMVMSIDGKVTGSFLTHKQSELATNVYYEINRNEYGSFLCGRQTMEESFTHGFYPNLEEFKDVIVPDGDFISDSGHGSYAIAIDRYGRLGWRKNKIEDEDAGYDNKVIIEVVTKKAPKEYLAYLRSIDLSYIICGDEELDLELALKKLYHTFSINRILLEGGSIINGVFNNHSLIDDLSLVISPIIGDKDSKPLFDNSILQTFELDGVETIKDVVVLKYYNAENYTYNAYKSYNDLKTLDKQIKQRKEMLSNATKLEMSLEEMLKIINNDNSTFNYQNTSNNLNDYLYLKCENEIIDPIFLNYLPTILNLNEKNTKNFLAKKISAVFDKENECIHFVKNKNIEKFTSEKYHIYTIIEYIKDIIKNINLDEVIEFEKNKKRKDFFKVLKQNNLTLFDIFVDKIIINSHLTKIIKTKEKDNNFTGSLLLKVISSNNRLTKIKHENAPKLIVEFETMKLQDRVNNLYINTIDL